MAHEAAVAELPASLTGYAIVLAVPALLVTTYDHGTAVERKASLNLGIGPHQVGGVSGLHGLVGMAIGASKVALKKSAYLASSSVIAWS